MLKLSSLTTFAPFGDALTHHVPGHGGTFPMPPPDPANPVVVIENLGPSGASVVFGTSAAIRARHGGPGTFDIPAGVSVVVDGPSADMAADAVYVAVQPGPGGCVLKIQRGTTGTLRVAGLP